MRKLYFRLDITGVYAGRVVLVWLHMIRFSFSKKASKEENLVLVLVNLKVTKTLLVLVNHS